jgi:hypothetical protein
MDIASTTESLTHLPIDAVLLIIVALIGAFDGYQSGASRVASLSMALLVAAALLPLTTHAAFLAAFFMSLSHGDSIVFAVLLVASYFLIRRMTESYGYGISGILSALLGGLGFVAVALSIWLATPALASLWVFQPGIQAVFAEGFRLYWILAGLAALAFARG